MVDLKEYNDFLDRKQVRVNSSGFDVKESDMNDKMFPFQKYCVGRALNAGRFALFENCGLGKGLQQLEWASKVASHEHGKVLIIAPLGVVGQTMAEACKFGYLIQELDTLDYGKYPESDISITNYENIDNIWSGAFCGVVLDESSILKKFDGKTKQKLIDDFRNTPYKLCCTATPSPNDTTEICNHAEFLNVMGRNEMLAMYFVHDGGSTQSWRLKGHAKQAFWDFVSTWAVMLNMPSDVGFSDDGYILPGLNMMELFVETKKQDNGMLFNDIAVNATSFHQSLRDSMDERLEAVAKLVNDSDESFIVWVGQDEEGRRLTSMIPGSVEVKGSDKKDIKRDRLMGFACGAFRVLITKLKIAQFGLNYQNCHNQVFASLDFSFESTYQGIRRSYRFGQNETVNIWLVVTDTMQNVRQSIMDKQKKFEDMQISMAAATNRNIKNTIMMKRTDVDNSYKSDLADLKMGDCVKLIAWGSVYSALLLQSYIHILTSWRIWGIQRITKSSFSHSSSW